MPARWPGIHTPADGRLRRPAWPSTARSWRTCRARRPRPSTHWRSWPRARPLPSGARVCSRPEPIGRLFSVTPMTTTHGGAGGVGVRAETELPRRERRGAGAGARQVPGRKGLLAALMGVLPACPRGAARRRKLANEVSSAWRRAGGAPDGLESAARAAAQARSGWTSRCRAARQPGRMHPGTQVLRRIWRSGWNGPSRSTQPRCRVG